tara:strand:- start:561 stop:1445 length:885 start_codon:yes stop_codon:yes gene_type:complete
MKVLITGSTGQVGQYLIKNKPNNIELLLPNRRNFDLSNIDSCQEYIKSHKPNFIINAGAYTNVEKAETNKEEVFLINTKSVEVLIEEIKKYNGGFLQISSDYVFNGNFFRPINTNSKLEPINYYGYSKAEAEKIVLSYSNAKVIRTSWIYSPIGKNFLLTILRSLKSNDLEKPVNIISDQIGCPTSADSLSKACWPLIKNKNLPNILHWTDLGCASWFDFAFLIRKIAIDINILNNPKIIKPINSDNYLTEAIRPYYSVLDCNRSYEALNYLPCHWSEELFKVLNFIKSGRNSI